jgi:hypothetical protein
MDNYAVPKCRIQGETGWNPLKPFELTTEMLAIAASFRPCRTSS